MKNGFALPAVVMVLALTSGAMLFGKLAGNAPRWATPLRAAALNGEQPEGGVCVLCTMCSYMYPSGDIVEGHYTTASGQSGGTGLGGPVHGCVIGSLYDMCLNGSPHPTINCAYNQAALPSKAQSRFEALAREVAGGSSGAYSALLKDFPDRVELDQSSNMLLFKGCWPGVFSGVLPVPGSVS